MVFNSINFLLFFPIVILIYYLLPDKKRYLGLLFSSYYFYMCWNPQYVLLLFFSTAVTYVCGLLMNIVKNKTWGKNKIDLYKRMIMVIGLFLNLSILFFTSI